MNIHDTACKTPHPVIQINGNFTILVAHVQIVTVNITQTLFLNLILPLNPTLNLPFVDKTIITEAIATKENAGLPKISIKW